MNLEDISQPNCYRVLDELRDACTIPVWHDDQQGTACVTLAGIINALKLAGKKMSEAKFVFLGADTSNTTGLHLALTAGVDSQKLITFDTKGCELHKNRLNVKADIRNYRMWEVRRRAPTQRPSTSSRRLLWVLMC